MRKCGWTNVVDFSTFITIICKVKETKTIQREITENAREKVLNSHTFVHRMNDMMKMISNS
jgi:spore maturation protein CgeB